MFMVEQVSFSNNSAPYGGALMIRGAAVFSDGIDESQNSTEFIRNSAGFGGAIINVLAVHSFLKGNTIFTENTAGLGSAVSLSNDNQHLLCILITIYTSYGIMQILLVVLYKLNIPLLAILHPNALYHLQLLHLIIALRMHHSYLLIIWLNRKVVCYIEEK